MQSTTNALGVQKPFFHHISISYLSSNNNWCTLLFTVYLRSSISSINFYFCKALNHFQQHLEALCNIKRKPTESFVLNFDCDPLLWQPTCSSTQMMLSPTWTRRRARTSTHSCRCPCDVGLVDPTLFVDVSELMFLYVISCVGVWGRVTCRGLTGYLFLSSIKTEFYLSNIHFCMFICSQLSVANLTNIKWVLDQRKDELETDDGNFCTMLE